MHLPVLVSFVTACSSSSICSYRSQARRGLIPDKPDARHLCLARAARIRASLHPTRRTRWRCSCWRRQWAFGGNTRVRWLNHDPKWDLGNVDELFSVCVETLRKLEPAHYSGDCGVSARSWSQDFDIFRQARNAAHADVPSLACCGP